MKYVVSEDLELVLKQLTKICGFAPPPKKNIIQLRSALKQQLQTLFGPTIEIITMANMQNGMKTAIAKTSAYPVSLDRLYIECEHHIDITRSVNAELHDCGETERCGSTSLTAQIQELATQGMREITLVDDVIFSGNGMVRLIDLCARHNILVRAVVAGIAIEEGEQKITIRGIPVHAVYRFHAVTDEICERDFYAGLPLSGRNVIMQPRNTGAPYFFPFGKPCEWASIPAEHADSFSQFCLRQNIDLWRAIEAESNIPIKCGALPRTPFGAPHNGKLFIPYLESLLH